MAQTVDFEKDFLERLKIRLERERRARAEAEAIAETGLRGLYEKEREVALLQTIAAAANEAASIESVFQFALDCVCAHTGWPVGHVYALLPGPPPVLLTTKLWHLASPERFHAFRQVTEATPLPPGRGLPGRVFNSGKPLWIVDVTKDSNFPRAQAATGIGVKAAFGFPVLVGSEVVAVFEFFLEEPHEPNPRLLEIMASIGAQLGRVVDRMRAAESRERLAAIVESSSDAIISMTPDGRIITWNPGAENLYGYSAGEAVAQSLTLVAQPARSESLLAILPRVKQGDEVSDYEMQHRTKDGRQIIVSLTFSPVRDAAGHVQSISMIARDITEQKRAEEELRQHRHHLEELVLERTAALTAANRELEAFCYSVSHDLRGPLRAISGFSQILQEEYKDTLQGSGQHCLERIRAGTQRMSDLIDQLLKLSRVTRVPMERQQVSLTAMARGFASDLKKTEPERRVRFEIADGLVANADSRLLSIALENLLNNAWKYTGKCEQALIEMGTVERDGKRVFFIRDNGAGFDMSFAEKLFQPFQRLHSDSEFPGTGIGLATVQRIIQRHGGHIWAEADVDKGATFYFIL